MKKVAIVRRKKNNEFFRTLNPYAKRTRELKHTFTLLKEKLKEKNYDLAMHHSVTEADLVFYVDALKKNKDNNPKSYLILLESLIHLGIWDSRNHKHYTKIFTWDDDIIDNKKYIKTHIFNRDVDRDSKYHILKSAQRHKLCTLINSNVSFFSFKKVHFKELYSARLAVIQWFEKHHLEDFDLYGRGWNKYRFNGPKSVRGVFNRLTPFLGRFIAKMFRLYPSYKGEVPPAGKKEILERYKFAICFENTTGIKGYISEKIFDCFVASCIPIYWGATNIKEYIPANCFIDYTQFQSIEEMYEYISTMDDATYLDYLKNIEAFLNGEAIQQFSPAAFVNTIMNNITLD